MKGVAELYGRVRYVGRIEEISRREAARRFGIDPRTVAKMLSFSVPPGYRRSRPPARPKLDPFVGIIDEAVADDQHADHQLGIDRGPADAAVVELQMLAHTGQIDEAINRAQQVMGTCRSRLKL